MASKTEIAWSYFEHLTNGELDAAAALLDDEGTWWTCGSRDTKPMAVHKELFPKAMAMVPFRFTLRQAVAEGDTVVLELESHAVMPDGEPYDNVYSFIITMRGDLLSEVREYSDSLYVSQRAPAMKALYAGGGQSS